jgi:hypothetical protein
MVMKIMEDFIVKEPNLSSLLVLLEIGSMLIVLMLMTSVFLVSEDLLVLFPLVDTSLMMKLLVSKLVVSLSGMVILLKVMMLGVLSSGVQ